MVLFIKKLGKLGNKDKKIKNPIFNDSIKIFPIFKKKLGIFLFEMAWGNIDKGFWL